MEIAGKLCATDGQGCAMRQPVELINVPEARLRLPLVLTLTGLGRSTLYRRIAEGKFPAPAKDGKRCAYWPAQVVRQAIGDMP